MLGYRWWYLNSQPLGYKPSALAIELNSSKVIAGKESSWFSWCIASLYVYQPVVDFSSEKYSGSTGHDGFITDGLRVRVPSSASSL